MNIIRYLNENQIKTSYGNAFNKNSIGRILRNKRYIGTYTYRGKEKPDSLPRIISDDLFFEVQDMMDKKKKAPARAKASESYILSTKLFCGDCKAAMTGVSATTTQEKSIIIINALPINGTNHAPRSQSIKPTFPQG